MPSPEPQQDRRAVEPSGKAIAPRRAIVLLLDSLNRHLIGPYGGTEFSTPNLDRFAARSLRFTRHYAGSLPCMPARHDLLCGALDFPWKPWGSVELWEEPITAALRREKIATKLVTDHPHLFESGGENYHVHFKAWEYQRGHESDPWRTRPDPSWAGAPSFHRGWTPYDDSRGHFRDESDFPGPRTMAAAARWIDDDAPHHDRFLLLVDEFDPHEPFDTPEPWASMYDPGWQGPHLIWPPYVRGAREKGVLDERQARQLRAAYGGKLTMIDAWLGRVLDAIDRHDLWRDTVVVVCTDHGHYLGEKDIWGKPAVPVYEPLGHVPLLIAWPGVAPRDVDALTTTVDLHATLADVFGVAPRHRTHGRSLAPLIRAEVASVREHALSGVWGREVHLVDGRCKYARAPVAANAPLSMWSNRWSTMPVHGIDDQLLLPPPNERAFLDRMPGSSIPVLRQPFAAGDRLPFWAVARYDEHLLFDLTEDPDEERNLAAPRGTPNGSLGALERTLAERLRAALLEIEAPSDQLVRLGLA